MGSVGLVILSSAGLGRKLESLALKLKSQGRRTLAMPQSRMSTSPKLNHNILRLQVAMKDTIGMSKAIASQAVRKRRNRSLSGTDWPRY